MPRHRALRGTFLATTVVALGLRASAVPDPLTTEIERWRAFLRNDRAAGVELLASLKTDIEPGMAGTEKALRDGLPLLALHRLASVQAQLAAAAYLVERPAAQRQDPMEFEKEWRRMGSELRADLAAPGSAALDGVHPAAVRAAGEAALFKVRVLYESSLEYGRNTMPEAGLYYVGAALAQDQFAAFCRSMSAPPGSGEARPRSLEGELDALQGELLLAYRPPASVDRHRQFIAANAAIKEARELDTAGLRYGALYRYLEAVLRVSLARTTAPPPPNETLRGLLREAEARLGASGLDHSIGQVYLQSAQANLDAAGGGDPAVASAIVSFVLPRYFAALQPEPPRPAPPRATVTVTLVRWPYT